MDFLVQESTIPSHYHLLRSHYVTVRLDSSTIKPIALRCDHYPYRFDLNQPQLGLNADELRLIVANVNLTRLKNPVREGKKVFANGETRLVI